MLDPPGLAAALAGLQPKPHQGVGFRVIDYEALHGYHSPTPYWPNPLFSLGASARGGRFTPKGGAASLYFALDPTTALSESWQTNVAKIQALGAKPRPPVVMITIDYALSAVLDLCDPSVLAALDTTTAELLAPWRPIQIRGGLAPTQVLGQEADASGRWQGILYPSSKTGGLCLVTFTHRLAGSDFLQAHDPNGNLSSRLP